MASGLRTAGTTPPPPAVTNPAGDGLAFSSALRSLSVAGCSDRSASTTGRVEVVDAGEAAVFGAGEAARTRGRETRMTGSVARRVSHGRAEGLPARPTARFCQ